MLIKFVCLMPAQWETFWDDRGQQTYRVNPLFSELCACSELRKQWKFTRYVCCRLALESLLLQRQLLIKVIFKANIFREQVTSNTQYVYNWLVNCLSKEGLFSVLTALWTWAKRLNIECDTYSPIFLNWFRILPHSNKIQHNYL